MKLPDSYGELIANYFGGTLWSYKEYGSYQGDYIAIIYKDSNLLIYKGAYGTCSGCDWLHSHHNDEGEIHVEEFMKDFKPFLTIPSDSFPKTEEDLVSLLPANTRVWLDDEYEKIKIQDLLKQISNPTCNNLDIVETEAKNKGLL